MLGDNIRTIRKSKKMSINKLSEKTGISLGYLSGLENNKCKNPTMDKLKSIADVLEVPLNQLLTTEERLDFTLQSLNKINDMAQKALDSTYKETFSHSIKSIIDQFKHEEFSDTEKSDIENFIKFVLSKRKDN